MSANEKKENQLSIQFDTTSESSKKTKIENIENSPVLEWVCHPARRNYLVTAAVSVFIVILVVVVYYTTYSTWFSILAFLILAGSLSGFYFPTRYRFTRDEIVIKTTMQKLTKKWSQYRSFYSDKNGVLLSPFARPTRLENFRGVYIKFWYNKDDVVAFVKEKIEENNSTVGEE